MPTSQDSLLEHVLGAVMAAHADVKSLGLALRTTVPEASALAVIRALLSADEVIRDTFSGNSPGRMDAQLARAMALALAIAADDYATNHGLTPPPIGALAI